MVKNVRVVSRVASYSLQRHYGLYFYAISCHSRPLLKPLSFPAPPRAAAVAAAAAESRSRIREDYSRPANYILDKLNLLMSTLFFVLWAGRPVRSLGVRKGECSGGGGGGGRNSLGLNQ